MKRKTAALVIVLLAAAALPLAAGPPEELQQVERRWAAAVTLADYASLQDLLSDELIYAHSTGVIETKTEYLRKLRTGVQKYDAIEHENMTVKVHGDSAVVHSTVRMRGASASGPFDNRLMMLHLWVKQGGKWRLAAHQTTRLQ